MLKVLKVIKVGDCIGDRFPGKLKRELPKLFIRLNNGVFVEAKRADVVAWINERLRYVK